MVLNRLCFVALIILTSSLAWPIEFSEISSKSFRIIKETSKGYLVSSPSDLEVGTQLVIVRLKPEDEEFEIIANGKIKSKQGDHYLLVLSRERMEKLPEPGDSAVPLGSPKVFPVEKKAGGSVYTEMYEAVTPEFERGYIEFSSALSYGYQDSTGSNQTNSFKDPKNFQYIQYNFTWFLDLIPYYGLEFNSYSATIPVTSYYREKVPTSMGRQDFKILIRTKKTSRNFRGLFFLHSFNEDFKTDNPDEYIISTKYSSTGLGARLQYEPGPNLYNGESGKFSWNTAYVESSLFPSLSAKDDKISRGASSGGSNRIELAFGGTSVLYFKKMPWVKRYILDLSYRVVQTNLKFQGTTKSEEGGIFTVPEGGNYAEIHHSFFLKVGVRFSDFIGQALMPRQ